MDVDQEPWVVQVLLWEQEACLEVVHPMVVPGLVVPGSVVAALVGEAEARVEAVPGSLVAMPMADLEVAVGLHVVVGDQGDAVEGLGGEVVGGLTQGVLGKEGAGDYKEVLGAAGLEVMGHEVDLAVEVLGIVAAAVVGLLVRM